MASTVRHARVVDFIRGNQDAILEEWDAFARTLLPASEGMSHTGLRDHAAEVLAMVVRNMEMTESADDKEAKSKRLTPRRGFGLVSEGHALQRIEKGFTLVQVVAEYRALRASVFRLWMNVGGDPEGVLRFNEAIDEALALAVDQYREATDQYRDELIGIVSHDLRNPLGGILMNASALVRAEVPGDEVLAVNLRIERSAKRMLRIVNDLIDLTRTRLGSEIPIVPGPTDAGPICQMVISELESRHPKSPIRYTAKGNLHGEWDSDRLAQVLSNLVANALQYGDAVKGVTVVANDEGEEVALTVHNEGPPISEEILSHIFEPMVHRGTRSRTGSTGLGLGLYIANELVTAHGGKIVVSSAMVGGTTFTVHLPRHAA